MKNLLVVLCLVILSLTFGGQCKASTDATPQRYASLSAEGLLSSEKDSERDMGCIEDAFQPRSERTVAVVSDVRNIYRICNSRPQRVVTSLTERSVRMSGTFSLFYKYSQSQFSNCQRSNVAATSPFLPCISGIYYVYALRHIVI